MLSFAGSLACCGGSCSGAVELHILTHAPAACRACQDHECGCTRPAGSTRTARGGLEVFCIFATVCLPSVTQPCSL